MTFEATRRGFLRGTLGATVLSKTAGCATDLVDDAARGTASPEPSAASDRAVVETTVNGVAKSLSVHPDDSALAVVRDQLGLTGCKLGCGHGACGACTMQVDGTAVATCILPATALHGRKVVTVEGIATSTLHPVQRAFMAEDGLQCGYCTPGFVVESVAFYDRWRAEHGTATPSRDEVAAALSGHLCRCAAYEGIYRAVRAACAGKYDAGEPTAPRYDAREKVTGAAKYTVDIALPGQLEAKALTSPYAHARVRKLDWSKALALPGVRGAVSLLGEQKLVRFAGQEIMALAAVDERTADAGLRLVEIDYEVLEPLLDMASARAPGAAPVWDRGADRRHPINASEGPLLPERWTGNVRGPLKLFSKNPGQAERAIADAERNGGHVHRNVYRTAVQCHTPLEPHVAIAHWEGEDLTVYMSTQAVRRMHKDIAERWKLPEDRVRVISNYIGGAFGSKGTLTSEVTIAVELARICKAPVRYALDRRSELMIAGNRPESEIAIDLGVAASGELAGIRAIAHSNSGIAVGHLVGLMMRIIYPEAPRELHDYDVVTHAPPGKPFRGPGGPMAYFALEQAIDDVAHRRGEDPLALRHRWDPNPARQPLYAWARGLDVWRSRGATKADRGRFKRGVGVAFGAWMSFVEPRTHVQVDVVRGVVIASTASQDMGNGTRTIIAQTIADELGLKLHEVEVKLGDSRYVDGPQSAGSRTTSSIVAPCQHACEQLKDELVLVAERRLGLRNAEAGKRGVTHAGGVVPWRELLAIAPALHVVGRRKRDKGGYFLPPIDGLAAEKYISSSIQIVEATVDTRLGRIVIDHAWGGFAIGRIVSPVLARSQAEGGIVQGLSYALYEERRLDPRAGHLLTAGLEDYRIAGIGDVPPITVHFEQHGYEKVRGRAVGLGELVTLAPAAALANAVHHATGWRPDALPLRPDRVLKGLSA